MKKIAPPKNFKTKYEEDDYSALDHIFEIKKYIKDNHSAHTSREKAMVREIEGSLFDWHNSHALHYLYRPTYWKLDQLLDSRYDHWSRPGSGVRKPEIDLHIGWHGYGRWAKFQIRWFPHSDSGTTHDYETDFLIGLSDPKTAGPIVDFEYVPPVQYYIGKNQWYIAAHYADLIKLAYRNIEACLSHAFKVYRITDTEKIFNGEDLVAWNAYDVGERFMEEFEVNYGLTPDGFINHMLEKGEFINTQRASRKFKKLGYNHLTPKTVENITEELLHYQEGRRLISNLKWRNHDGDNWPIFNG